MRILAANFTFLATLLMGSWALAQSGPTDGVSAVFGIVVDKHTFSGTEKHLLIATRHGLLRAAPDGVSHRIGNLDAVLTTLAAVPGDPSRLFVSGLGADGSPIGFFSSVNGGRVWTPVLRNDQAIGALKSLVVSRAQQSLMIALSDKIQISEDGGQTWKVTENTPDETLAVAPSSLMSDTIYSATTTGLKISRDGGTSWANAFADETPVTMVRALSGNQLFAFVYGVGLVSTLESDSNWQVLADGFEDRYILNLAEDPDNSDQLYASMDTGAILSSSDGGISWISFEGSDQATPERLAQGKQLYEDNCQACHGVKGIGESPDDPAAKDEFGFKAPALNDDMHAWHHSDANLVATIQNGSSRNSRMAAFRETLSDKDIENLVAYVKSLWNLRSLSCQGGRHMTCMGH